MKSSKPQPSLRILLASFVIFAFVFGIRAEDNQSADFPTPVLISEADSARALAIPFEKAINRSISRKQPKAFTLNSKIVLYVTNLNLMPGEGANAFRVYVEDAKNRKYRFPVSDVRPVEGKEWVYALTVELRDVLGFYKQPVANGDVLISVTWRGLASNRVRLGLGKTGGSIKDDANAAPTPFPVSPFVNPINLKSPAGAEDSDSADRIRFMEQATFGPTPVLDEKIRRDGFSKWLDEQVVAPYPTIPYPNIPLMPFVEPGNCNGSENPNNFPPDPPDIYPHCRRDRYTMFQVQNWFFKEAFYGEAQLRHRVAWALSQMWVVSGVDTQQASHMIAYHKVLSDNAFGNYRTLMQQMTLNPGMGNYLDMLSSTKDNPNENYAREILQLFTIGVFMLNPDGTKQLDENNNPIPTYNQKTINNFTKVFTGWGLCEVSGAACPNRTIGAPNYKDPMLLKQNNHDVSAKTLLNYPGAVNENIDANLDGNAELDLALDNIYNHPNVAPFVSRFLIQHLVTSDPTPAFVGRISTVFDAHRTSPTQLKEVVKAILLDPEARGSVKTDPNYGKLREPAQLATNLLRQFGVQSADGTDQSDGYIAHLVAQSGQNIFYSPTVFNYYPPDYVVPGPGLNGPEFATLTTGTAISRANFINTVIFNNIKPDANTSIGTSINLSEMRFIASTDFTCNRLIDALNEKMMHGALTEQNKATILNAVRTVPRTNPLLRAKMAVYLIATSSQYQVQR
ncbi:MAG TPA: DUF1800 domain-containing protein [Pyrinomonadaceae bacterium]|jgi:uncharacterized protein (DUF1800 family)